MVSGTYDIEAFIKNGEVGFANIEKYIKKYGIDLNKNVSILDWGGGVGRVAHLWEKKYPNVNLCVSDYNPLFVFLLKRLLKSAVVIRNNILPPLNIEANSIDVVYAISVFTHLDREQIVLWMDEIYRILGENGVFIFSVQGDGRARELSDDLYGRFKENGFVEIGKEEGSNYFASFHCEEFMRDIIDKKRWKILEFVPDGAVDARQDLWIIRKQN